MDRVYLQERPLFIFHNIIGTSPEHNSILFEKKRSAAESGGEHISQAALAAGLTERVGFHTGFGGGIPQFLPGPDGNTAAGTVDQLEGLVPDRPGIGIFSKFNGPRGTDSGTAAAADTDRAGLVIRGGDFLGDSAVDGGDGADAQFCAGPGA